jgi:hypothetical protein
VQDTVSPDCTVTDADEAWELEYPFEHRISYR